MHRDHCSNFFIELLIFHGFSEKGDIFPFLL